MAKLHRHHLADRDHSYRESSWLPEQRGSYHTAKSGDFRRGSSAMRKFNRRLSSWSAACSAPRCVNTAEITSSIRGDLRGARCVHSLRGYLLGMILISSDSHRRGCPRGRHLHRVARAAAVIPQRDARIVAFFGFDADLWADAFINDCSTPHGSDSQCSVSKQARAPAVTATRWLRLIRRRLMNRCLMCSPSQRDR